MVPPYSPPYEAIAIVRATLPEVTGRHAAIALRMWHYLPPSVDREAIFGSYGGGDEQITLVQALIQTIAVQHPARMARFKPPSSLCADHGPHLEQAFRQALADLLGPMARNVVLNAWCQLLRSFVDTLCPPSGERAG